MESLQVAQPQRPLSPRRTLLMCTGCVQTAKASHASRSAAHSQARLQTTGNSVWWTQDQSEAGIPRDFPKEAPTTKEEAVAGEAPGGGCQSARNVFEWRLL